MRYIDKISHQVSGNHITQRYLGAPQWDNTLRRYVSVDYDGTFRKYGHRDKMIEFLDKKVQDGLCCYCMRNMRPRPECMTLEHIIPQHSTDEEFAAYQRLPYNEISAGELTETERFIAETHVRVTSPPFPHTVAYHNFVLSCNGSFIPDISSGSCCNNARGNKFLEPVYFRHDIADRVTYDDEGYMRPVNDEDTEITQFITSARLNCDNLRQIRYLWFLFSSRPLHDVTGADSDDKRRSLMMPLLFSNSDEASRDVRILNKFVKPIYWEALLEYSWFWDYYSTKKQN